VEGEKEKEEWVLSFISSVEKNQVGEKKGGKGQK